MRRAGPVRTVTVPRAAVERAAAMAGGDLSRLTPCPDGAVIVWNSPGQAAVFRRRGHRRPR